MTGKDVFEALYRLSTLHGGEPFTVYVKLDNVDINAYRKPGDCAGETIEESIREEARGRIDGLLKPAVAFWERLCQSCWESGIFFKDPKRGTGIRLEQELSEEQEEILKEFLQRLEAVDTFIVL